MTTTFDYRDDLYSKGRGEDGEDIIGRAFYVVATTQDGRRFAHDRIFYEWPEEAIPKVEALIRQIERHRREGGKLDPAHWTETDPAYGSDAYAFLDRQGVWLARERQRDRDYGENVPLDHKYDAALELFYDLPDVSVADI